ncbi:MAG TPA: PPE family protein [Mycobacterium sp.]|uniref:PPE family protein n=1 Tax=Mycobacterium sp. TaxID=1785 RepID=UPI002B9D1DC8|nr:PPE family protein [Mycobacterium sp.]HME77515.1 PPE family protein [Mycobacterium sp.]
MDFGILPPEVNSGRMYAGPGSGSMLAAAAGWDGLAAELYSAATDYGSVIAGLTSGPWLGPASASMAAAAASHVAWLMSTAAQAEQAGTQAKAAAAAHATAFAMTVPPPVIVANRALLMVLVATNILGQNTPAIAATEAHYGEMWAQDAVAMYGYAASSASASTLTPFTPQQLTTNPGGLAGQAVAVGQAVGTSAGHVQAIMSTGQLMSAAPQALQGLASPLASTAQTGLGAIESATSNATLPSITDIATAISGIATAVATTLGFGADGGIIGSTWGSGAMGVGASSAASAAAPAAAALPGALALSSASGPLGGPALSAGMGQASTVGGLSVPPSWATTAPEIRLAAATLPSTSLSAVPASGLFGPMPLFGGAPLMAMGGRGTVGSRHRPVNGRGKGKGDNFDQPLTQASVLPSHWTI